ncbi:MAG: archease [Chloroflexi bacterium]|nr:archease [Chloroflexota bacterium]
MPFEELPHTADWALRVWADDLPGLLAEAARGMYALADARQAEGPRVTRRLEIQAPDAEGLLVDFLGELLYFVESERLAFDELNELQVEGFRLQVEGFRLQVEMTGAPLRSIGKEIKAVTYHNLQIKETARGLEVEIVFDV